MAACLGQAQLEHPAQTIAGVSVNLRPLPKRPAPLRDELLSSWTARLARANHCSVPELCGYLGFGSEHPPETSVELAGANIERFGAITQLSSRDLDNMLLARVQFPFECMSWSDFQYCPTCTNKTPGIALRHWRFAWSLNCEICGSELRPVRRERSTGSVVSSRQRVRAFEGVQYLKQVYHFGNRRDFRRVRRTMQVAEVLEPRLRRGALFSQNHQDRYAMLAALGLGKSRPMLATALIMRSDTKVVNRLRSAFPFQRKLLERLVCFAASIPNQQVEVSNKRSGRLLWQTSINPVKAGPEYLAAARQAIIQLGEAAERGELLRCAESILRNARQQPEDISRIALPNMENIPPTQ